ncbi:delta(14)-sterol reductase LBR [Hypomesus transpacificus]|uniref:delta(14)-sterol reductase LBR n=1 Tax=Hypomesus transpacificus TaxID=137520 RepID=UPI001F078DE7|nr:delta(14)-sterol reductase LBR [Hypomesus transpacificus]XP_046878002.1 delta(14)-sterol reductase LBR [Hypomesus transpacificus]XP_046878003.1 delta(14)-sterol reductase LBR [Hypomesus transpacificus]XP_046878004.1 delta(14)-sterol reductase LBR [Hypomesus transpacificus]
MPSARFQSGEMVMGRWPGSNLYYEVKVLGYEARSQLYTVVYKDGTELELRDADIKSGAGFRPSSRRSRSRSRSPSRRRSRSRSPARTTRRSSSRTTAAVATETPTSRREPKLKEVLEVRLSPLAKPVDNNSNNKHEKKEENDAANKVNEVEGEPVKKVESRYNLRRRKDDGDARPAGQQQQQQQQEDTSAPASTPRTTELEFGGRIGVVFMLLLLPCMVLCLLVKVGQQDASVLAPLSLPSPQALWDPQALALVCLWILLQALLHLLPVGKVVEGLALKSGQCLQYRINGFSCLVLTALALGAALHQEVDLTYVHSHFLQLAVASTLVATLLSLFLYARSRWAPAHALAPGGHSGNIIYDFFMGHELNPRIRSFDLKFFCELRPGLIGWVVINMSMALAEMRLQGLERPSAAMILVNAFQLLYVLDALWNEEAILTTMDIVQDGFGFMLAFGDLVWVPFVYSLQAFYLVSHPSPLTLPWLAAILTLNAVGYVIFRKANSQKNAFRRNPDHPSLAHLKTIPTATGKSLLVSGLWGVVRHPNYLGDIIMALAWSLPCGLDHLLPYFYVVYFTCLLVHREARDEALCRRKYGSAWDEYCSAVHYRIIPGLY